MLLADPAVEVRDGVRPLDELLLLGVVDHDGLAGAARLRETATVGGAVPEDLGDVLLDALLADVVVLRNHRVGKLDDEAGKV